MKITKYLASFLLVTMVVSMVGCQKEGKEERQPEQEPSVEIEVEQNVEEEKQEEVVVEIPENQNLLTGLADLSEEAIGKRPVAVMVNNVNKALPQYGIEEADVIFEMHVEGDLTRLMAMYADYTKVPKVCAIRSCRYYYPVMAHGFDAFYVNWGFDETMRDYVNSLGIPYFDGMVNAGKMFGRDQNRINSGYSLEHTAYFDGTKLAKLLYDKDYRIELLDDKKGTAFLFNGMEEQIKPNGEACTRVHTDFGAATATFEYDTETNTYFKYINGKKQMDSVADTQIDFTNLFILETNISVRSNEGHKKIDWQGGKNAVGYYVSNGAVQKITWSKASESDYLKFYDENGQELAINRGKSYIAFNYANRTTFE